MLKNIKGINDWHHKDCKIIYRLWRWRIMKKDESDGDSEFTMTIGLGGKSPSYWKVKIRQFWKWRGVCRAYRNPISKSNVGQTSLKNKGKTCRAQVVSTTKGGTMWNMDWGSSEKAKL
jgi:hypothetical protein